MCFPFQIVPMADSHSRLVDLTLQTPDDGIENITPPAPHAACTICLGPVEPSNESEPPFHWPGCQHPLHLSCVANLRAHTPQPTCPACRHPWDPATETSLQTLCHQHGILIPDPASHLHVQHEDPQPPAPPPNILPLCCHRVILVDPNRAHADEAWRELPDRHMQWAPYFDQRQQQWTPEWTCPRCSTSITPGHHLLQEVPQQPHCPRHGPRTLVVDIPRGERGWACTTSTNPPHLRDCNPVALPPAPATMPATTTPTTRATAASRWHSQGPPAQASNPGPTNSWLYVPLLHAGVGRLTAQAEQAWLHHPNSTQEWHDLVQHLRNARPVPWQQLHHTLVLIQQLAVQAGRPLPTNEANTPHNVARAAATLPPSTQVHLPWALEHMTDASGYIPASAQETLLQHYLGERLAARAAMLADQWRRPAPQPPSPPAQPTHTSTADQCAPATTEPAQGPPGHASSPSSSSSTDSTSTDESSSTPTANTGNPARPASHPHHAAHGTATPSTFSSPPAPPPTSSPRQSPQHTPRHPTDPPPNDRQMQAALRTLDNINLQNTLQQKCYVFSAPPSFLRGRFRAALSFALRQILTTEAEAHTTRAWKLWFLLPRMLLHRPPGTHHIPKSQWRARIQAFQQGDWDHLLREAAAAAPSTTAANQHPTDQRRAERARHLVHQGELSAARQALTAGPTAPGTASTLAELRDPERRPASPYESPNNPPTAVQPTEPLQLPAQTFLTCLRKTRKGAAPGPSGLTADALRVVLDDEETSSFFVQVCHRVAQAQLPPSIATALGLGRMIALQKPNGRVRGLVIGDILRRTVSRAIAQHFSQHFHAACSPHQYALSTRAGTGAIVHALTTATQSNPSNTILSIDGVGAYDTISRRSMLQALAAVPEANQAVPFVRLWYAQPSQYVWHDEHHTPHTVTQAEGGEQGDPLMPALFSLGQHQALETVHSQLEPGEQLYVFLDDVYAVVQPHRVRPVYNLLANALAAHAHIQLNQAKTRAWNSSGQQRKSKQKQPP